MTISLPRLPPDEPVTAAHYNALADAVQALRAAEPSLPPSPRWKITGSFPIEVRKHPGGLHVSLAYTDREALVELTTTLSSGGSAKAKVLWYKNGVWSQADTEELTVYDAIGTMEGNVGDKALVKFHRQSGLWIVWQLRC